ncbi:50S ribosomal protein L25 [Gemmatimonadota bacterium]
MPAVAAGTFPIRDLSGGRADMERSILHARSREDTGSRAARRLRRSNSIPAILYGHKTEPMPIVIDATEFDLLVRKGLTENTLISLIIDDAEKTDQLTLIRDVQRDPLRDTLRHLDLVHVDLKEKLKVEVPVRLIGQAEGVKAGGILEQKIYAVEIECLPTEIPSEFEVDVTEMNIGDSLHLNEIDIGRFETSMKLQRTVVSIGAPRVEVVEEEVIEILGEPELIGAEGDEDAGEAGADADSESQA